MLERWGRQWHPTPVLLPWKSHGQRSLVGCSSWVTRSRTRLSNFTFTFHFHALEKEMATHPSVLAWRIPGMGEPVGLPSMGSHRVGYNWSDSAAAAAAPAVLEKGCVNYKGTNKRLLTNKLIKGQGHTNVYFYKLHLQSTTEMGNQGKNTLEEEQWW